MATRIRFNIGVPRRLRIKNCCRTGSNIFGGVLHPVHGTVFKRNITANSGVVWFKALETLAPRVRNVVGLLCRYSFKRGHVWTVVGFHHGPTSLTQIPRLVIHRVVGDAVERARKPLGCRGWPASHVRLERVLLECNVVRRLHIHVSFRLLVLLGHMGVRPLGRPFAVVVPEGRHIFQRGIRPEGFSGWLKAVGFVAWIALVILLEGRQPIQRNSGWFVEFLLLEELGLQWVFDICLSVTRARFKWGIGYFNSFLWLHALSGWMTVVALVVIGERTDSTKFLCWWHPSRLVVFLWTAIQVPFLIVS